MRATRRIWAEGGVVVAHPGRQWVYEVALAAQEQAMLQALATGFYFRRESIVGRLVASAPRSRLAAAATDRFHPTLDQERIVHFSRGQVLARLVRRSPGAERAQQWADHRWDHAMSHWLRSLDPRPRVVHCFEGAALATLRAARAIGPATVLDVGSAHERFCAVIEAEGVRLRRPMTERINAERALADVLVVPSDYVADCLIEHDVPPHRIVRIPFGVDVKRFAPTEQRDGDVFRVLFVGSSSVRKGLRYLLEAWAGLDLPQSELVVAGAGDRADRKLLRRGCRWLGQVPRSEINRWFGRSDVFVFPSLAEGSAHVTYEAMAAGLPVVTTPNAGSVVRDGLDGYLVPPRDTAALRDRIRELYENPDLRRALGRSARTLVVSEYTWEHYRARVAAVHRALLAGEEVARVVAELDAARTFAGIAT